MLRQLLSDLLLDFFERGQFGVAHIFQADDVVAKLGLHRHFGGFALAQRHQRFGKLLHVAAGVGPIERAAIGTGARVFGRLLGDFFKLAALLELGNDGLGLVFLFHQDVARLVFLAAVGGGKAIVFGLDVGVGHGVLFLEVTKQFADQNRLACQFDLALEVFGGVQAARLGFLHEDFAGNHFVLDLAFHFRGNGAA